MVFTTPPLITRPPVSPAPSPTTRAVPREVPQAGVFLIVALGGVVGTPGAPPCRRCLSRRPPHHPGRRLKGLTLPAFLIFLLVHYHHLYHCICIIIENNCGVMTTPNKCNSAVPTKKIEIPPDANRQSKAVGYSRPMRVSVSSPRAAISSGARTLASSPPPCGVAQMI